jgi:hypothetical protein
LDRNRSGTAAFIAQLKTDCQDEFERNLTGPLPWSSDPEMRAVKTRKTRFLCFAASAVFGGSLPECGLPRMSRGRRQGAPVSCPHRHLSRPESLPSRGIGAQDARATAGSGPNPAGSGLGRGAPSYARASACGRCSNSISFWDAGVRVLLLLTITPSGRRKVWPLN